MEQTVAPQHGAWKIKAKCNGNSSVPCSNVYMTVAIKFPFYYFFASSLQELGVTLLGHYMRRLDRDFSVDKTNTFTAYPGGTALPVARVSLPLRVSLQHNNCYNITSLFPKKGS